MALQAAPKRHHWRLRLQFIGLWCSHCVPSRKGLGNRARRTHRIFTHSCGYSLEKKKLLLYPNLRCPDGSVASTGMERLKHSIIFFVSQNRQSAQPGPLPFIPATFLMSKFCEFNVKIFEVERHRTPDVKKATGDDGVPTRLLQLLSKNISRCVHIYFA